MSTIAERILHSQQPGYWAVQIRQSDAIGPGRRYLCHARDDRAAVAAAGRLMGSALTARGFDFYRIDPVRLEQRRSALPALGENQSVTDPAEWTELMAAREAPEQAAAA